MQTVRYVGMLSLIASGSFTSLHSTKCQLEHRCSRGHSPLSARHECECECECECDSNRANGTVQQYSHGTAGQTVPRQWVTATPVASPSLCCGTVAAAVLCSARSLRRILPAGSIRRLT